MRDDWDVRSLGDVCGYQNGFAFKSKTYRKSGTPVIRISDIQDEKLDLSGIVHIDRDDYRKDLSRYEIVKGDLLIAMSGATTGKIGLVQADDTFLLNQRVGKFQPKDELDKKYLFYYLSGKVEEVLNISAGSAQPNLSTGQIKGFQIPLPPLDEQKRIVDILDDAFEAIDRARANIKRNIENAEELFQSKLDKAFKSGQEGWKKYKVKDLGEVQTGTTPPTKDKSNYGDYIPFVKPAHFQADGSLESKESMLSKRGLENGRLFRERSILMVCIGASIGKTGYSPIPVSSNQQINALSPNEDFDAKLIYYGMITKSFQKQVVLNASQTTLPIINKSKWSNLNLYLPVGKNEQGKIIKNLNQLRSETLEILNYYRNKIEYLDELKKSILQQAFSGQLTEPESGLAGLGDKQDDGVRKAGGGAGG